MSNLNAAIIDDKEREALKKFREKIPDILATFNDYYSHDLSLLRWLRARELDVKKAEELLRKSMEWRAKDNIDSIFEWKVPEFIDQNYQWMVSGFDKDGNFVVCAPFGRWDIRKGISLGKKSDILRNSDLVYERLLKFFELRSTNDLMITQFTVIVDFEGFSFRQLSSKETIECYLDIIRHFEDNYPETLKVAWIINAPKIFEVLYALVKPLLTPRTTAKIKVNGCNPDQWRPLILENVDPDQLASRFGGSNTSCRNYKGTHGYDIFTVNEVFPENEFISVNVAAGMKHSVPFSLCKNSKLSWNFRTTGYDIGFALILTSSKTDDDDEIIFESPRAPSHVILQKGTFVADKPGDYLLVFDNSFSKFRSKDLLYCARYSAN